MIKSLAQLEEEIAKGQQFEFKSSSREGWVFVGSIGQYTLGSVINLIKENLLRIKQVKS